MDWTKIPYFDSHEFDDPLVLGSGDNINREVVLILSELRKVISSPIIIHSGSGGAVDMEGKNGHSANSYHLFKNGCKAVDFHIDSDMPHREQIFWFLQSGFRGMGIYYDWVSACKPILGFHGDVRDKSKSQIWTHDEGGYKFVFK